ncbi:MAG: hypothetical protein SV775_03565 [Thermodesulfobacteriota bacterium]|nr:hypothetical protein [Thermodesulfobacteriota bacterium]
MEKKNYLDLTNLIRSIQRLEGNPDCFRKAHGLCDRPACAWRKYCLEETGAVSSEDDALRSAESYDESHLSIERRMCHGTEFQDICSQK